MKKLRLKKLKKKKLKRKLPEHLFKKGECGRRFLNDNNQCSFYHKDGKRCENFAKRNSRYCRWHGGKEAHKQVDFDLLEEIEDTGLVLKGRVFSLSEYPQLVAIYKDRSPEITIMKAAQCGVTEWAIQFSLQFLRKNKNTTVIYTLPSRSLASSVSKLRIDGVCNENSKIFLKWGHKGKLLTKYDSVYEKQIKDSFLYLQGTWQSTQTISTPGDVLMHDEVDFCKGDVLGKFRSRIGNSDFKYVRKFSTPTYPEYGIHKEFLKTDQHHWWYKCEHCGHIFMLCCSWPDVLHYDEKTNMPYFGCVKCHKEIKRNKGWWKAENPGVRKRGYHVTKLASPRVSAGDMLEAKDEYKTDRDFCNFELGMPFSGDDQQLTPGDIELCEDGRCQLMVRDKHTCMGVDQGGSDLWVIVLRPKAEQHQLVYIDHLSGPLCWNELGHIMTHLGVVRCVVDGLPNTIKAEEFQLLHKKKVYLAYYQPMKFGEDIKWQPAKGTVILNRNKTLDAAIERIRKQRIQLPISDKLTLFKKHLTSLIKIKKEDKNGETYYEYKKIRQDHFGHAYNYANAASEKMDSGSFEIYDSQANARKITEGMYSDNAVNHLAALVLDEVISINSLYTYRYEKLNGKFVEEMGLSEEHKSVYAQLELKHKVKVLISSLQKIDVIEERVKLVKAERLVKLISGGDDGTGNGDDEPS